jgi:hypothetical protein
MKWMPDDQVTNCYDCHVEFSMFTRKHHCRICGQVFCWKCSNNYINGVRWNYSGEIRVCNFCHKLSEKHSTKKQQINDKTLQDLQDIFTHLNQYEIGGKGLAEKQDLSPTLSTRTNAGDITPEVENPDLSFSESKDEFEPLAKLTENSFDHLKRIIEHFCKSQGVDTAMAMDILEKAQTIVHYLNVKEKMDIRNYVKLKTIPGKKMELIHGIAFRSKLLHRKMKENFTEPKILLLSCPIEFYRTEKYVNLDILMKQETSYLQMIIEKIFDKKPDIILCEKSIARVAQDLLLKHDITCMMNVKQKIMKKISHCTGIDIFHSVDEITTIKTGKRFYKSNDGLFVCENSMPNEISVLVDNGKIKNILLYSIFCAYHLRLETEFFLDEQGTITEETKRVGSHLISISPNVVIPEPIDPNVKLQKKSDKEFTFPPMIYSITNHQNIILLFTKLLKQDSNKPTSDDPEIIVIAYYTENDMSIGNYLEVKCFNKNIIEESLRTIRAYTHSHGRVNISVELSNQMEVFDTIHMWSTCKICQYSSQPCQLSESSWKYSFGKFLETTFYNSSIIPIKNPLSEPKTLKRPTKKRDHANSGEGDGLEVPKSSHVRSRSQYSESSKSIDFIKHSFSTNEMWDPHVTCTHSLHQDHIRYFSKRNILVKVEYTPVAIYEIEAPPLVVTYEPKITAHGEDVIYQDTMEFLNASVQEAILEHGYPKKESIFLRLSTVPHDVHALNAFVLEVLSDIARWKKRDIAHIKVTLSEHEGRIKVALNDFESWNVSGCACIKNQMVFLEEPTSVIAYALKNEVLDVSHGSLEKIMRLDEKFHLKSHWKDDNQEIQCTCYFAKQFAALRAAMYPTNKPNEDPFVISMTRCKKWKTTGGKSGSTFMKSWDDRFLTKQVSRVELNAFLETGAGYFEYMTKVLFHELPSLLVKILGVYRVSYYNQEGKYVKYDLIVMENLFYNRSFMKTFDLKGSIRNRYQKDSTSVLLDQNLLESFSGGDPLLVREPSKALLTMSVYNDTLFLSKLNMMDYSLLVGVDQKNNQLVVGIIDYIRQYTWDKSVETWVKSATIMGSKNEIPTIISPKDYKLRFREAMNRYFVLIPDKFTGLLKLK